MCLNIHETDSIIKFVWIPFSFVVTIGDIHKAYLDII